MDPEEAIARLHEGHHRWRRTGFGQRSEALRAIAAELEASATDLARLMAREMGKPVTQGKAEAEKCARVCRHYADHGAEMLADEAVTGGRVTYEPLGVIFAIMPWNFPLWQAFRFAAPALMAGNTILLKHSSLVPGCSRTIMEIVLTATGRGDLLLPMFLAGAEAAKWIGDPRVRAVTFTGSTEAGREVAAMAGRHLKKSVLELGGSDPYLILEDADLDHAARICAEARMVNGGQSCIAAKRFIVRQEVAGRFTEKLTAELSAWKPGDPREPSTVLGPMAETRLRDELHSQVLDSIAAGAELVLGGEPSGEAHYPPTLLKSVLPGMRAFDEETFGPVATVTVAENDDHAVRLANLTSFGLGGAVFSADRERALALARRLEAGSVAINGQVVSDPRRPFGGIKDSGWGRELGTLGIREFVNVKTIAES